MNRKLTLELTEEEWMEVANAVYTKQCAVERGDYGASGADCDIGKWIRTLKSAHEKLVKALDDNKIPW